MQELEAQFLAEGGGFSDFTIGDLFDIATPKKKFDANKVTFGGKYPYVARLERNNGIRGYITEDTEYLNPANTVSFGQDTATMYFQDKPYFTGDKIKIFSLKKFDLNIRTASYLITVMRKAFVRFSWGSMFNVKALKAVSVNLPCKDGAIAFDYMADYIRELEADYIRELEAYLRATGFSDYTLTPEDEASLAALQAAQWASFRLDTLFGKATRGKRLKSADRISGSLPFVTAGEADTGISAFIGNAVTKFAKNTVTIDMFGSAKYRHYEYGADDHVAVVHTQKLPEYAGVFVAAACHKAAYTGQFSYSRNFYAKDADELQISLPVKSDGTPDYGLMRDFMEAVHKLVIQGVAQWSEKKAAAYRQAAGHE